MPWTPKQHRYFEGIAHGSIKPTKSLTKAKAATMAREGIMSPSVHRKIKRSKKK